MSTHDVSSLVAEAALDRPEMLAVVESGGRSVTWGGLEDEVARVATGLGAAGVVAGQRAMVAMGNRIEFVTAYLGVLRAQVVAVPVNPRATSGELARMIADSGSRLVLADAETIATVRDSVRLVRAARAGDTDELDPDLVDRSHDPRVYVVGAEPEDGEQTYDALRAAAPRPVPPLPDPEKLACLLYTSGTSGRPRAAMLTHRALLANIEQAAEVEPPMIHGDDVVLGVLPLFHVYGLNAVLGSVLRHRAQARTGRALRSPGDPRPDRRRGGQRRSGGATGVRVLDAPGAPARAPRPGPADAVRLGSALAGAEGPVHRGDRHPDPPGIRPHRRRRRS
jgi:long-chain acyl-CoA synthetase